MAGWGRWVKGWWAAAEKRKRAQINKGRNEKGDITMDTREIQRNMRDYYKQIYANKVENLEEMDKCLEK